MQEQPRVGLHALETATALLRRVRLAHPTAGLLEAADLHWWWRTPRRTDGVGQLFWFDEEGRPEAAVIATDWGDAVALDPIVMPGAAAEHIAHVIERGLAHAAGCGFDAVDVVIDRADDDTRELLHRHGFTGEQAETPASATNSLSVTTAWLQADARPQPQPLPEGYRLCTRLDTAQRPHHMARRSGGEVEARLRGASLYRPALDLLVLDGRDQVAAYGLFWFDPETRVGLVEPMRTEDEHQRRGLGRHVLAAGIDRLAEAGARRVKICYQPGNAAARDLYLSAGFEADKQTAVFTRRSVGQAR